MNISKTTFKKEKQYTIEEHRKILKMFDKSSFANHQLRTLIWIIFWPGMHLREAVNIREMDVDIELETILVRNQKKYRTVYIQNTLAMVLEKYISIWKDHINRDYARKEWLLKRTFEEGVNAA